MSLGSLLSPSVLDMSQVSFRVDSVNELSQALHRKVRKLEVDEAFLQIIQKTRNPKMC